MKTITCTLVMFMLLLLQSATAQVAINLDGSQPDSPAMLDVQSNSMGIYVPRVQLTGNTDQTTVSVATNADTSLLIFNLNLAGTTATDSVFPGFYYWSGTIWLKLATGEHDDWHILGNTGTDPTVNFVGTTDNKNLMFRQNNIEHFRMTTKGQLEVLNTGGSVFIGEGAGINDDLGNRISVYIGYKTGNLSTTGWANVAIGANSLTKNTSGGENVVIGAYSLVDNTTGESNSAVGWGALWYNTTGYQNIAFGHEALQGNRTGNHNIGFGTLSLGNNQTGHYNVVIGNQAGGGSGSSGTNLNNNTILGYQAGESMDNGANNNILLGFRAADELTTGANNIMIGYNIGAQSITGNNQLSIGNILFGSGGFGVGTTVGTGNIGIGEPNPDEKLHVAGKVKIDDMISGSITDSIVVWSPADSILKVIDIATFLGKGINKIDIATLIGKDTNKIVFAAEYAGSVIDTLSGTGNHIGEVTAGNAGSANSFMNYYQWESSETALQDYDIIFRFAVPSDFGNWDSASFALDYTTEGEAADLSYEIFKEDGTSVATADPFTGAWATNTTDLTGVTTVADEVFIVVINLRSSNDDFVRVGDITLTYITK